LREIGASRVRLYFAWVVGLSCLFCLPAYAQLDADSGVPPQEASSREYGAVATATRLARPARLVAASVTVIPTRELTLHPGQTTDAVLRTAPALATFRRSSSLVADPSSQGLNLRGVGPSGVSRSLVLLDGAPVNDPFAGSIYFRALPRLGLERAEIVPGGGSALYGSSALSGVVQLISRDTRTRALEGELSYGSMNTWQLAARAAGGIEQISGSVETEWLRSDGYRLVKPGQRGPIDQPAHSEHITLNTKLDASLTRQLRLSLAGATFSEQLWNATRYTSAGVGLSNVSARLRYDAGKQGMVDVLWFGRLTRFDQERARVAQGRVSEARSARQRVPARDTGVSITWSSAAQGEALGHQLLAGVDARYLGGTSHERLFPPEPMPTSLERRSAGGRQLLLGAFVQDLWRLHRVLQLEGALRGDLMHDHAGQVTLERFSGARTQQQFDEHTRLSLNPRLGVLLEPLRDLRIRASAYRSFRVASLNELYRPFQVGTVLTAANPALRPETLYGAELGIEQRSFDRLTLRATGFFNLLDDPIVNASLPAPLPDGSMRQRKNLGRARVAGLELSADVRVLPSLNVLLAYTYADSRVTQEGPVNGLRGKRLAQDPLHRASALVYFDEPRWCSAALALRYVGAQYEDDLNTLRMRAYAVLDVSVARRLWRQLELFAAAENLWDQRYLVGRAGIDTLGQPFTARVGLRVRETTR
jgi:iron complex outermembrane receptor protein